MSLEIHQKLLFLLLFVKGFNCLYDEGPSFTEEPPFRVEFINELGIRLNCSAKGRPSPSIRWTWSDGGSLVEVPGLRYFSSSDGSLVFPPFSAEAFRPDVHSSTYRCIASNSVGTIVSRDVQLRAVVKEPFEARVEAQRGASVRGFPTILECVINPKYMRDYVIVTSWVRDMSYNILPGSLDSDNKYDILSDGRLLIWQLGSQDSLYTYQCRVLHRLTGHTIVSSSGNIFLNDLEGPTRPEIQFQTSSVIVKENDRVILPCIAIGLPKPSFRWFKKEGSRLIPVIDDTSLEEVRSWDSQQGPPTSNSLSSSGLMRIRHGALIITSVKVAHKGIYLCNSSNSEGESGFLEVELIVRSPLTVTLHPEKLTVDLGKNAEFSCGTTGDPQPGSVSWLKDGTILRAGSGGGRIRFLNQNRIAIVGVVREDQGMYQCVVKNDYETGQQAALLRLGDAYPQFIYRFIEQTLQPGPAISLKCSSTGNPTPKVSWLLDGFPLPQSDRFLIGQYANVYGDVISHVNITSVRIEDGGEYSCQFGNRAGIATHSARLNIYGQPYVRPMPDILATAGQRLTIKCPVGGYPVDHIIWERDGMKLPTSDRQSVSSNGTLSIDPVERSDEAKYSCTTLRLGSTSQRPVNVRVMVPPKITPFTFPTDLHFGERASIQCVVVKGDLPLSITWVKDNVPLTSTTTNNNGHGHSGHQSHTHNNIINKNISQHNKMVSGGGEPKVSIRQLDNFSSVLSISSLESGHSGNYTCESRNNAGIVHHTSTLRVNVPAKWVVEPSDQSVSVGSHVAIHCQANGFPIPTIKWKQAVGGPDKKEFREVGYRTPGVLAAENGTLIISRVLEDHEAHYLCLANNAVGPGLSKLIRLTVNAAPRIRSRPPKEMIRRGETVRLRCEAEGDEPIRISWIAKGISLNDTKDPRYATIRHPGSSGSGSPSVSELTIREISIEDRGDFECIAINAFGQDSFRISLLVQERPQVPKNFRLVEHTSRTVVLSWFLASSSEQDANVLDYIVWYKEELENWSEQTNKKSTSGDQNTLILTGLSPATTYDFQLYARNQLGMSDPSEILQVTTDGEPPGGPPLHVTVEAISSESLRVSWQPPAKEYRHGHILGYNIGFKRAREGKEYNWTKVENTRESSSSAVLSTSLHGLDKFNEYEVVIKAYNEQGQGPTSQPTVVTTLEDVPSAPPADVSCSSPSAHSISINWQAPAKKHLNGIVLSFKVLIEEVQEEDEYDFHVYGSATGSGTELESRVTTSSTAFHGLSPFTNFSIQIAAATAVGDGILSQPIYCRTLESVPEQVAALKTVSVSAESFIVSWLPPKSVNGRLQRYHLYIRILDSGSGREIRTVKRTVPPSTWNYEVAELKRREAYEVWITAETQVGEGPQSPSVNFTPLPTTTATNVGAAIVSFGKTIAVPWKTEVAMPCMAVGYPKPIVNWKRRDTKSIDPSSNPKYEIESKDNVLRIKNVQRVDNMNYTCNVRNPSGSDQIVYSLQVQVPPTAPLLHQTSVTANSVRLQWKQGDNGGSHIRGFILNFRPLDGEWEEITLSRKLSTYQIQPLRCGQVYEFFLSAFNKIGGGSPSETVKVTTKGSRPLVPTGYQTLEPNSKGLKINLEPWNPPDCPLTLFTIEYKVKGSSTSWNSVRHEVGQERSMDNKVIQINEMTPETDYIIRMRAVNPAGASTAEYEISTSVFKGGLRSSTSSKFNLSSGGGGGPSSSSSSSSSSDNGDENHLPFYQDMHIILPLIISLFAIISASATVLLWLRKKKIAEGMMESTNSLAFRRDPNNEGAGGRGGGIGYMADRDYTVIRAKLMPDCDYIPESADDIYPYATFHLPEKENLGENIPEGFLGPPSSQRLSNPETIPIRQISRGPGHNHQHGISQHHQHRRKSRSSMSRNCGGESSAGESEEYDDSCGSDSEAALGDTSLINENNMGNSTINRIKLNSMGGVPLPVPGMYSTCSTAIANNRGTLYRNDETLLVSDRKSLPRGGPGRSKFLYGYSSNQPRMSGGGGGLIMGYSTVERRGGEQQQQELLELENNTATTSFIYGPPPQQINSHLMELSHQQKIPTECDNRISNAANAARNNILGGGGRFMTNSGGGQQQQQPPPTMTMGLLGGGGGNVGIIPSKLGSSIMNNSKLSNVKGNQQHNPGNIHSDYTIAV